MTSPTGDKLVITGAGCLTPLGHDPETFASALADGVCGITSLELPPHCRRGTCLAGQVPDFAERAAEHIPPAQRRRMTRLSQMAAVAAGQALHNGGLSAGNLDTTGLTLGTAFGSSQRSEQFYQELLGKNARLVNPGLFPETVPNAAAGQVAILFGLRGPNCTVCEQAVSSEAGLILARDMLLAGMAERFLVLGLEEVSPALLMGMDSLDLLRNGQESGPKSLSLSSRTIPGEAAVALLVETEAAATSRGQTPLARVVDIRHRGPAVRRPKFLQVRASLEALISSARDQCGHLGGNAVMGGTFLASVDGAHRSALADQLGEAARICVPEYATGSLMGAGLLRCLTACLMMDGWPVPLRRINAATDASIPEQCRSEQPQPPERVLTTAVSPGGGAALVVLAKE
jgi:3-oxoacyl-[acyl-carrier-protein] synthase II